MGSGGKEEMHRLCEWELETWEHVVEECMREEEGDGREKILKILENDGRGEKWMRRLQERREERETNRQRQNGPDNQACPSNV